MVDFEFIEEQLGQAVEDLRAFVDASYDCYDDYIPILDEDGEEYGGLSISDSLKCGRN